MTGSSPDIPSDISSDTAHFTAIPWCAPHLKGTRIIANTIPHRALKPTTSENSLFADTLNTSRTVRKMLQVYQETESPTQRVDSAKTFLTLGDGMNGHADYCHGGMIMAILDEIVGSIIPLNQRRKTLPQIPYMTAYLNTTFVNPIPTPSTILAQTRCTKIEGRKFYVEGTLEDENGTILARAEALFIQLKSPL
ncbi:HotDog domain-containing protein [Xylaria sp. CBS 124048]|nr:HotDog domain-containing protein [Xylaria sp. CBS 124048]